MGIVVGYVFYVVFISIFASIALAIYYSYISAKQRAAKLSNERSAYASAKGYTFWPGNAEIKAGGSYSNGVTIDVTHGKLPISSNEFWFYFQTEVRGSGKNQQTYHRSVAAVRTPDILSQFVFNSKLNTHENTGGNLDSFARSQKLSLEGNFSEFFDILIPSGDESDALTLLSPDVMQELLTDFIKYDIEVKDQTLYLYAYSTLDLHEVDSVLQRIDSLVTNLKLRQNDHRSLPTNTQPVIVARTAVDNTNRKKLKSSPVKWVSLIGLAIYFIFSGISKNGSALSFFVYFGFITIILAGTLYSKLSHRRLKKRYKEVVSSFK